MRAQTMPKHADFCGEGGRRRSTRTSSGSRVGSVAATGEVSKCMRMCATLHSKVATQKSTRRAFWNVVLPAVKRTTHRWVNWNGSDSDFLATTSSAKGVRFVVWVRQADCGAQVSIDGGPGRSAWNKSVYDYLLGKRSEIEKAFGGPLRWDRLDDKQSSSIAVTAADVGWKASSVEQSSAAETLALTAKRLMDAVDPHVPFAADYADAAASGV